MNTFGSHAPSLSDRPWLPLGPNDVELNRFNGRPSAGLVSTEFGALLFWQFAGHGSGIGMWLYLPVTDAEAEYIVDHADEPMLDGLDNRLTGRQVVLGLSREGRIWAKGPYVFRDVHRQGPLVRQMLRALASGLTRAQPELPSGRRVEIAEDSGELKVDATHLVNATLEDCAV